MFVVQNIVIILRTFKPTSTWYNPTGLQLDQPEFGYGCTMVGYLKFEVMLAGLGLGVYLL